MLLRKPQQTCGANVLLSPDTCHEAQFIASMDAVQQVSNILLLEVLEKLRHSHLVSPVLRTNSSWKDRFAQRCTKTWKERVRFYAHEGVGKVL